MKSEKLRLQVSVPLMLPNGRSRRLQLMPPGNLRTWVTEKLLNIVDNDGVLSLIRSGGAAFTQQWQLKADELNKRNKLVAPPGELSYQIFRLDNLAEGLFPRDAAALN
jgi:hypothetical protein